MPYRKQFSLAVRMEQVAAIKRQFPQKIPVPPLPVLARCRAREERWELQVVVERFRRERALPELSRCKFLVPTGINMTQFIHILRSRLELSKDTPIYLLVDNKSMASMNVTMGEVPLLPLPFSLPSPSLPPPFPF